jgi:hypothetical protein
LWYRSAEGVDIFVAFGSGVESRKTVGVSAGFGGNIVEEAPPRRCGLDLNTLLLLITYWIYMGWEKVPIAGRGRVGPGRAIFNYVEPSSHPLFLEREYYY